MGSSEAQGPIRRQLFIRSWLQQLYGLIFVIAQEVAAHCLPASTYCRSPGEDCHGVDDHPAAAVRPFNTDADLAVIDLDRAHLCPCDAFNLADPGQCLLQRWRQVTSCRQIGAYLVHRSCRGSLPSIDDEAFVTLAINCDQRAAVDGEDAKARSRPKFPEPLLRSAPSSCDASRATALS